MCIVYKNEILNSMKKHLIFIVALGLFFASCKKDRQPVEEILPQSMENMEVPADFNWKTTTDYQFEVRSALDGLLIFTNGNGTTYHTANLNAGETYEVKLTLPAYLQSIQLKQIGRIKEVSLASGLLNVDF